MSHTPPNRSVSCLLCTPFDGPAIREAVISCRKSLGGDPDLVIVSVSSDYRAHLPALIEHFQIDGHARRIIGSSTCGSFGVGKELENTSGVSFSFLRLPETSFELIRSKEAIGKSALLDSVPAGFIVMADPFRCGSQGPLREINTHFAGVPAIGGMITGGPEDEDLFLFTEEGKVEADFLALGLCGGIRMVPLVAQGCRPVGEPMVVTGSRSNVVHSIGGREPFRVLEEAFGSLGDSLKEAADGNIFAGLAIREEVDEFEAGDFLIRFIVGVDLADGKLILTSPPRVGQTLQFQLRNAGVAKQVLKENCESIKAEHGLPFSSFFCGGRGRGRRLYGEPDQDAAIIQEVFGAIPVTGFYGSGEFGPVAEVNFRHDHSLCGALFYPA